MIVDLIDVGYGNLASVTVAFQRLGAEVRLASDARAIARAERLVLPGVGSAAFAMQRLGELELLNPIRNFGRPLLGICVGMQLLFEESEEAEGPCLGILQGKVARLTGVGPVPHMGWSRLRVRSKQIGIQSGDYAWFAHSFACEPTPLAIAHAEYGRPIPAVVERANVLGCQFHPERSSNAGARFLESFLER